MKNYAQARQNMLDCQLEPNGIISPAVLEVFEKVPREQFLPPEKRAVAYLDEDLPIGKGFFCMEPVVLARMVQAAAPEPEDTVLNIGDKTGYSSAILSDLVSTVVTIESQPGLLDNARQVWDELDYCNIAVLTGSEREGNPDHAPYSLIFVNGAVATVPEVLLEQLAVKGRLVAVIREKSTNVGRITVIEKIEEDKYSTRQLYDAATPYVPGFEPVQSFVF